MVEVSATSRRTQAKLKLLRNSTTEMVRLMTVELYFFRLMW